MQLLLTLNECVNYTTAGNVSYVYEPYTIFRIIVSFLLLPQTINLKLCVARWFILYFLPWHWITLSDNLQKSILIAFELIVSLSSCDFIMDKNQIIDSMTSALISSFNALIPNAFSNALEISSLHLMDFFQAKKVSVCFNFLESLILTNCCQDCYLK